MAITTLNKITGDLDVFNIKTRANKSAVKIVKDSKQYFFNNAREAALFLDITPACIYQGLKNKDEYVCRKNKSNAKVSYDKKTEYKVGNSKKIYVYKNKKLVKVVTGVKRTAELYNVSVTTLSRNLNKWSYLDYNGYRFSYKELY